MGGMGGTDRTTECPLLFGLCLQSRDLRFDDDSDGDDDWFDDDEDVETVLDPINPYIVYSDTLQV